MKKKICTSYMIKYLLSNLFILIVPLIIGSIAYTSAIELLEQEVQQSNLMMLQQSRDVIDRRLEELENTVKELSVNSSVKKYLKMQNPLYNPIGVLDMKKAQESIKPYGETNSFLNNLMIYSRQGRMLISPKFSVMRMEEFYGSNLEFHGMNYDSWEEKFLNSNHNMTFIPPSDVTIQHKDISIISLIHTLPYNAVEPLGNIILTFNENEIKDLLSNLHIEDGGYAYIVDEKVELITSIGKGNIIPTMMDTHPVDGYYSDYVNGEKVIVSHVTSQYNGWNYVAVLPFSTVMCKVNLLRKKIIVIVALIVGIGTMVSLLLAYRNGKPLKDIVQVIRDFIQEDDRAIQGNLMGTVTQLINNSKDLQERIKRQQPIIRQTFLEHLLYNTFSNQEELENYMHQLGEEYVSYKCRVIIIQLIGEGDDEEVGSSSLNKYEAGKLIIQDHLQGNNEKIKYIYDMDYDKLALVILPKTELYSNSLDVEMMDFKNKLLSQNDLNVKMAGGNEIEEPSQCYKSFREAKLALDYSSHLNKVNWYHDLHLRTGSYYYPVVVQQQLLNLANAGQYAKIKEHLLEIKDINNNKRKLSKGTLRQLNYTMYGTVNELIGVKMDNQEIIKEAVHNVLESVERNESFDNVLKDIEKVYEEYCSYVNTLKNNEKKMFGDEVVQYIQEHYNDSQLSLVALADHFNFSTPYINNLIKNNTGVTFATYLETLRIDQACQLLNGNTNIKEIAVGIGYSNAQVFRRAFKRVLGINPSSYKEKNRKKEESIIE